jgi:hypothetical protein
LKKKPGFKNRVVIELTGNCPKILSLQVKNMAESTDSKRNPLDWLDGLLAAGVFAAAMVLYVRTLATTLLLGDTGEYQVLAYTLGLAHGPGYPIYLLLAKLETLLVPVRDIAYRVNLFSAIMGALALALVYLIGRALGGWRASALVGPVALGLCQLFWWHSVIAETYTPGAAMLALILLLVVLWRKTGNGWLLFWAGLAGGLSVGVHYTVLMAAPAVLLFLALAARRRLDWLRAASGTLLGIAICLGGYFAMDAYNPPSSNINSIMAPNLSVMDITPQQFASPVGRVWYLVSGRQFQGELFSLPKNRVMKNLDIYFNTLKDMFPRFVLGLAVLGLLALLVYRGWREGLMFLLTWLAMLVYIINYDIGDIYQFYVPSYVPLALAVSLGAACLLDGLAWLVTRAGKILARPGKLAPPERELAPRAKELVPWTRWAASALGVLLVAAILWGVAAPSAAVVKKSWRLQRITFLDGTDWENYPYPVTDPQWPHEVAKTINGLVEDNAIIFTDWSLVYDIYYVAQVEHGRTGISVHETYPAMTPKPFAVTARQYVKDNYGKRPIYFTLVEDSRLLLDYNFIEVDGSIPLYRLEKR